MVGCIDICQFLLLQPVLLESHGYNQLINSIIKVGLLMQFRFICRISSQRQNSCSFLQRRAKESKALGRTHDARTETFLSQ